MANDLSIVVPIRKNSQRVKNKNFKIFNKKNLLIYKIEKLKKLKKFDEIIINTDSERAIKIAQKMNVSYWKRDKHFASSNCSNSDFWKHIAETTQSKYIMFTNCTSPLVKINTYQKIINKFLKIKKKYGSINTVTPIREFVYLNKKAVNFNPSKAPKSQDIQNMCKLNFAVNIISKKEMKKRKTVVSKKPFFYELDEFEGFDIDTPYDFKIAEFLHSKF